MIIWMNRDGLLKASFHAERAKYHSGELNRYRHSLPGESMSREQSRTERFDAIYIELLPLLAESHAGYFSTPEVPVRGEVEGAPVEALLRFAVNGEGDRTAISYAARARNGGSDSMRIRECRCAVTCYR